MPRRSGGGGGGGNQMQAMAQARDAMNQKVIDALNKLSDELKNAKVGGGGGGGGGGGSGGGGAGGGSGGAGAGSTSRGGSAIDRAMAQAQSQNAGMDAAQRSQTLNFGASALQRALAAGGASSAASLLGGLTGGGLPGLGLAAAGEIGKIAGDYRGIHTAGRDAALNGASLAGRNASRAFAESQASQDFVEKDGSSSILGVGFEYGKGFTTKDRAERGNDQVRRSQNQREEDRLRSGESAVARTERQIEALSRTGVFNDSNPNRESRDRAEAYAAALYRFNKKQADGVQSGRRYIELIDSHLNAPNNQPKVGG